MTKNNQISQALQAWNFLRLRKNEKIRRQLNLALASDFLRLVSFPFAIFWFLRWSDPSSSLTSMENVRYFIHYADAFILCQILSTLLDSHRIQRIFLKAQLNSGRQILIQYSVTILVGTFALLLPISTNDGQSISLIDALFITISALSVTGLSPVDVGTALSLPGLSVLLFLIQLGGLGIVLLTAGFSAMTFSRLSMNSMLMSREMYGSCHIGQVPGFLTKVVSLTLLFETVGAFFIYFSLPPETPHRLFMAVFHSVSAFCNAGFSPYSASAGQFNFLGVTTISFLILIGGTGYPILLDLIGSWNRKGHFWFRLNAHSRLTLLIMGGLLVIGAVLFFLLESLHPQSSLSLGERMGQSLFYSISSRTAGFNLLPMDQFQFSALFWLMLLMIIGANPSSTGGGIKTTTLGVLFIAVLRSIQGQEQTVFMKRAIPPSAVIRALTVIMLYGMVAGVSVVLLIITERQTPFAIAFEVISALSTVGLSLGITGSLTVFGKMMIMFLMLFGRIGILSFVLASLGNQSRKKIKYPYDDFFVG